MTSTNNIPAFSDYVCYGDTITIKEGLFTFTAEIHYDEDPRPWEYDCYDEDDPIYGEENKEIIRAWKADEWFYCGIVITASYNNIPLNGCLADLWGIEANLSEAGNEYLNEVVRDLLPEAREEAVKALEKLRASLAA